MVLLSAGAVAAAPGYAPDGAQADENADDAGQADDHRQDGEHATESGVDNNNAQADEHVDAVGSEADGEADSAENATAERARKESGPPTDMTEPVPDFVSQLHQQIMVHLSGDLSGADLGEAIADLTPDEADNDGTEQSEQNANA